MTQTKYKVLILGAGTGGISIAARLVKKMKPNEIAIVDPSDKHYYQPLWTLVGAGIVKKEATEKPQKNFIPKGVHWIKDHVLSIDPENRSAHLGNSQKIDFEYLVIGTGLRLCWEKIQGLKNNLGKDGICSIYQYDQVDKAADMIQRFSGGTAVFTMPPVPIKCAGAPQKIMYLADEIFRKNGVRKSSKIIFTTAGKAMFGVPVFSKVLDGIVQKKEIQPNFQYRLTKVDPGKKLATFETVDPQGKAVSTDIKYDLLHIVPPMAPHSFIADSKLAFQDGDQKGWLAVNKFTLQHTLYPNIFGIGDVTGIPNSKTGAAIRKQVPVVVTNLLAVIQGKQPPAQYDGYSSCPLVTGMGKVMLAEFGYDGKLMPSFPVNPAVERRSMWHLKKDFLPILYWKGMLRGRA